MMTWARGRTQTGSTTRVARSELTDVALWKCTLALAAAVGASAWLSRWTVSWESIAIASSQVGVLLLIGLFYEVTGRSPALSRVGFNMALAVTMALTFQATTYACATIGRPFQDAALAAADAAFGFSWRAVEQLIVSRPSLARSLDVVYALHLPETVMAVVVLALRSQPETTRFLRAFALSFAMSLAGLLVLPALGNLPEAPSIPVRFGLRAGTYRTIELLHPVGLIAMPSFHAILAVLLAIVLWPVKWLRWPAVAFNTLMLVATIHAGGHYLVDVLAGIGVAVVAVRLASPTSSVFQPQSDRGTHVGAGSDGLAPTSQSRWRRRVHRSSFDGSKR